METSVEFGSLGFFELIFDYYKDSKGFWIILIVIAIFIIGILYSSVRRGIRMGRLFKHTIKTNTEDSETSRTMAGIHYRDLGKETKKELLTQALLLTLPVSLGFVLIIMIIPLFIQTLFSFGRFNISEITNIVGAAG